VPRPARAKHPAALRNTVFAARGPGGFSGLAGRESHRIALNRTNFARFRPGLHFCCDGVRNESAVMLHKAACAPKSTRLEAAPTETPPGAAPTQKGRERSQAGP
jgi:hypothetical protein